jgi:thiamine biosynthesis protein ThiS
VILTGVEGPGVVRHFAATGLPCDNPLVELQINGESKTYNIPLTLAALISSMGLKPDRVAVELNLDIVPRDRWAVTNLSDGDRLEIVQFVGGGS